MLNKITFSALSVAALMLTSATQAEVVPIGGTVERTVAGERVWVSNLGSDSDGCIAVISRESDHPTILQVSAKRTWMFGRDRGMLWVEAGITCPDDTTLSVSGTYGPLAD